MNVPSPNASNTSGNSCVVFLIIVWNTSFPSILNTFNDAPVLYCTPLKDTFMIPWLGFGYTLTSYFVLLISVIPEATYLRYLHTFKFI